MASENVVRRIEIVGTSRGLGEVEDKLRAVGSATDDLAKATEENAKVTETASRRQISAAGAYDRLRGQLDQQYRAQRQLERGQQTLDRAMQQGLVATQAEYDRAMKQLRDRYLSAAAANDNFRAANDNVAKSVSTSARLIDQLKQSVSQLVLAYVSFQGVKALGGMADEWSDMQSRVGAAVKDMEAAPRLMQRIVDIANASYSPLSQTVEIYSRNVAVLRDLGGTAADAADFTEALNHALVLTATRGQQAESVQNALAKAMAVGKLQADGLQTILAHGGEVAQVLADELGTTQNNLYKLAAEGKITGDVIANALIKRLDDLRERAGEMPATIGDAFVRIGTNLTALVGQMASATGGSGTLAEALIWVADNLDNIAKAAAVAGVAMLTAFSPAILSSMAFGMGYLGAAGVAALNAIRVAVLANPLGALATALVTLTAGLYLFRDEIYEVLGIDVIFEIQKVANRIIGLFVGAYAAVTDAWGDLPLFFRTMGKEAWNNLVSEFEKPALTINGRTIIPGLDLSGLKSQLTEEEKAARDRASVAFDTKFLKDYIDLLPEITAGGKTAAEAAEELRKKLELAGGAAAEEYTKMVDAAQRRIDQMREEIGLVGKTGIEADALRFKYDLLAKAKEQNITIGDDELRKINELTDAYRGLSTELAAMQAMDDILFERSLIGLTDSEQRILGFLRQIGIEADSAFGKMIAGAMRTNEVMQEAQDELKAMQDIGKDAFMSILDLLYETGDIGEKLIGIFANIGKQFAKMGMERLWKSISEGTPLFSTGTTGTATGGFTPVQTAQIGREIGNAISPPITDSLNANLQSYAAAIRKIESGSYQGNYGAVGPMVQKGSYAGDHAYGAYQVMGKNIASWTREATGTALTTQQFLNDRAAQDKVFYTKFGQSLDKFGTFADGASVWFSGRPLNRAGNASDGYNTVPQYVQKAEGALAGYNPGVLKTGVSAGMVDASRKIAHMPEMAGNGPGGFAPVGGGNLQNMLGIGGAAFGAFAGGMQSGDPISGALSGAMAGFGAAPALAAMGIAGPVGIIGGAIVGLIGGLLGQAKKKREELAKAREELESQMGAITKLIADSTGNFMGAIEQTLLDRLDEFGKAIKLADKAQNSELSKQLSDARVTFIDRTIEKWRASFEETMSSLTAGTGFDGEFLAGVDAVEKMRESLVGFVNDAKLMSQSSDEIHAALNERQASFLKQSEPMRQYMAEGVQGQNENLSTGHNPLVDGYMALANQVMEEGVQAFNRTGGQLYKTLEELREAAEKAGLRFDETGKLLEAAANDTVDYSGAIAQAMEAAQRAALVMLSGAEEFTAVEKAVQKMHGAASMLPEVLEDLGMSAEQAASAIDEHMVIAMDKLREQFEKSLDARINIANDQSYINELRALVDERELLLRDTVALGLASAKVEEVFLAEAGEIVAGADASASALRALVLEFPAIAEAVSELIVDMRKALETDLRQSINSLSGLGWFNEIEDALEGFATQLTQALETGADHDLVSDELDLRLKQIVGGADLAADQLKLLADALPATAAAVTAALEEMRLEANVDLARNVASLSGQDWINDAVDARESHRARMDEVAALGLDAGLAMEEYTLRLGQIADGSDMSAAALRAFAAEFPEVATAVDAAISKMRSKIDEDMARNTASASGLGWLNEFVDTQAKYAERLGQVGELGASASMAMQELDSRLRQIVSSAEITDDQLRKVAAAMPLIGDNLLAMLAGGAGVNDNSVSDALSAVERAKSNLRQAYDAEANAIRTVIQQLDQSIKRLKDFREALLVDDNLSPLSNRERLDEAAKQFDDIAQLALGGDADALAKLDGVATEYLNEARQYHASSEAYFAIFQQVYDVLGLSIDRADEQITYEQRQLDILNRQVGSLIDLHDGVMSVHDAIAALKVATAEYQAADAAREAMEAQLLADLLEQLMAASDLNAMTAQEQLALSHLEAMEAAMRSETLLGQVVSAQNAMIAAISAQTSALTSALRSVANAAAKASDSARAQIYLVNNPDVLSSIRGGQSFGTGLSDMEALAKVHWENFGQFEDRVKGYANGGDHFGGLRIVGERGPELEATGASRIWTAHQTQSFLRGGNDNRDVVAALGRIERENTELRREVRRLAAIIVESDEETRDELRQGTSAAREQVSVSRRKAAAA